MTLDDLISTLFQDVASPSKPPVNGPGEIVRQTLAGNMPGMGSQRPAGGELTVAGGPRAVSASVSRPAPAPAAATSGFTPNPLSTMSRGYRSGGLFGAIGNLFEEPERLRVAEQQAAQEQAQAQASANQTVQALVAKGVQPEIAQAAAGNPVLMKQLIETTFRAPEAVKPTSDMLNYEQAKRDGFTGTFMDYKTQLGNASATKINMAGDKAWEVERAKLGAKKLDELATSAQSTAQIVDQMETMQAALDAYNKGSLFGSGNLAPYEVSMRGWLKGLGVGNADTLAGGELARSVQNQMALLVRNPESGMGMPGALSDADRVFLVQTMPGIDKSPQGNRIMIEVAKRAAQRKMEVATLAEQYALDKGGMEGFQTYLTEWAKQNPIIDDEFKAQIAAVKAPNPQAVRSGRNGMVSPVTPAQAAPTVPGRRRFNPETGEIE